MKKICLFFLVPLLMCKILAVDPPQDGEESIEDPFLSPDDQPGSYADITEFADLPLLDWEKQIITHIFTNMAEKNVFQLLLDKTDMEKKGKKIHHVPPLRLLAFLMGDKRLKKAVGIIKKNPFKWSSFIDGLAGKMREELAKNNIYRFVPGFAQHLNVDAAEATAYIQQGDFAGLVSYLLAN